MSKMKALSNLEYLQRGGVLREGITMEEAVRDLTDPLNCVECIAFENCADCYGQDTKDRENPRCKEVVRAYLKQDYIKKEGK